MTTAAESQTLVKGQKADLTAKNDDLDILAVGIGWKTNQSKTNGQEFDMDVLAITFDANKNPLDMAFFNERELEDGAISLSDDNRTGNTTGEDGETLTIDLNRIPDQIDSIAFGVNINQGENNDRNQNFGMIENAFVRLYNQTTGEELYKYDLSEEVSSANGVIFGNIYRHGEEWKVEIKEEVRNGNVEQIFNSFNK